MKKTERNPKSKAMKTPNQPKPYPVLDEHKVKPLTTGKDKIKYEKSK